MSKIKGKNNPINSIRSFDATYKSKRESFQSDIKVDIDRFLDDFIEGNDSSDLREYIIQKTTYNSENNKS